MMGGFPATGEGATFPVAANVLNGSLVVTATTGATTIITVPAGRTWIGQVAVSCAVFTTAAATVAGEARATASVAGAGASPPAGTIFEIEALVGANAVGGVTGNGDTDSATVRVVVIAPAANAVTLQGAATITGSGGRVSISAVGELQ